MTKIVLDAEAFKALSSDTRLQILKALDARRLTVSEMGRLLGLNKATVFEHLKQLAAAELVKKEEDEGRKWVYYRLTWKGRNVVHPENAQFLLLLATGVLSVGGVVASLAHVIRRLGGVSSEQLPLATPSGSLSPEEGKDSGAAAGSASPSPSASPELDAQRGGAAPAPVESGSSWDWAHGPDVWILGLLVLLIVLTSLLAWRLTAERRRERATILRRLEQLPGGDAGEQ